MAKKLAGIIAAGILSLGLCSCGVDTVVDDIADQTANIMQAEDEHVLGIKHGVNERYPDITYDEAFRAFFAYPTWKYFKGTEEGPDDDGDGKPDYTNNNIDVVEFTGTCTYRDVEVKALIQFTLNEDGTTFDATYLSFNDVPQSSFMLDELLITVFEDYIEENGVSQTAEPQKIKKEKKAEERQKQEEVSEQEPEVYWNL